MYADREEADSKRSIKERLNGNFGRDRRQVAGKRQRQDDKWEHDLYDDNESQLSTRKAGDLRLKLQRKSFKQTSGTRSVSGVRDLREKLSGTMKPQPMNADPPRSKVEAAKSARRTVAVAALAPENHKVANTTSRKKTSKKVDTTVDEFLTSLDLEKYSITFQAEEVDMTALVHMTDEDLKALGIPMGPRKKILLALESRV
ncbi:PREDICTED: ankyrin repeat and SAM domain-containing protein 6 isoform X1 [Fragaria vesca subsp. vesca]|uniref:ankyrin repeat and SAM domain-containing protein 6 isoform X1 n=1 Tax=Fragaria vesca subsp. vesca TaxID=101020 RepID=UPI0002C3545B|nr:PREDICTED: ankyrin repeat and SAM domain-containing protein 6 isoform X1 [Fragaria vesca subsp. vesca]